MMPGEIGGAPGWGPTVELETDLPGAPAADRTHWLDTLLVTLLAVSSLLAAWSGYQATLWNNAQATANSEAANRRLESARATTIGYQNIQLDIALLMNWLNAYGNDNTELADFYSNRFTERLAPAFAAWSAQDPRNNPDAPSDPFAMPEYRVPELEEADRFLVEADAIYQQGQIAGANGDRYVATTVILAIVLFFAGIAPQMAWQPARLALVTFALVMFIFGFLQVISLPPAQGWENTFLPG
jgi:hypothetical protein